MRHRKPTNVINVYEVFRKLHDTAFEFFKMSFLPIYLEEMTRHCGLLSVQGLGDWLIIRVEER